MKNTLPIVIKQGSLFSLLLVLKSLPDKALRDLSTITFQGQIRFKYNSPDVLATFTLEVLDQVTNKGQLKWTLPHVALSSLVIEKDTFAVYDIEEVAGDGSRSELFSGTVTIKPEVTK